MKDIQTKNRSDHASSRQPFFGKKGRQGSSFFSRESSAPFLKGSGQGAIQTKLTIGQPNDIYEKEADHMADKVVQRSAMPLRPVTPVRSAGMMLEKCAHCEKEEQIQEKETGAELITETIRKKPIFESEGEPADERMQRKCAACENEQLQKKGDTGTSQTAPAHIESGLAASKGAGSPLPEQTQSQMETSFGADFSGVRIHNNSAAAAMNQDLHAQAFTQGKDIYFNSGKYDPGSRRGQHLLAHELTHTLQQNSSLQRKDEDYLQPDVIEVELVGPVDTYTIRQTGDVIRTGEAAGPRILLRIELGSGGTVTLTWYNFYRNNIETGDLRTWLGFRGIRAFYYTQSDFDALSSQLTPAQWRSLGNDPLLALLELHEKGTIHIPDEVIMSSYKGMIYAEAKATLDRNQAEIEDLLNAGDRIKKIQEYTDGLKEASRIRDMLLEHRGEIEKKIAPDIAQLEHSLTQAHSFSFGIAGNLQNMDTFSRLKLLEQEDRLRAPIKRINQTLEFWYHSFPLLTRMKTDEIRNESVEAKLREIKNNIVETRPRLDEALVGKGSLNLMDLNPIRARINENLGPKASTVVEAEDKRAARAALATGIGLAALGILLLFVPGGVFIDAAIGFAMAISSIDDAFVIGTAANTGLNVDDGLMDQAQAHAAKFSAAMSVIFAVIGGLSAGFKVLRISKFYRAIGEAAPELSFGSKVSLSRLLASHPELISEYSAGGKLVGKLEKLGVKLSPEELASFERFVARAALEEEAARLASKFEEFKGACSLGSINCRTKLPDHILDEAGKYPDEFFDVPMPNGPFSVQKSILSGVERGTEILRNIARKNRKLFPEFDEALAKAEKKGGNWPYDKAGNAWEVHHVKPVFMGGDNEIGNLFPLPKTAHQDYTTWWNRVHAAFKKRFTEAEWDEIYYSKKDIAGSKVAKTVKKK